ncbi:MAG: hypothetical protein ACP5OZ_00245 [Candidatus Woesearchaeota archaeon]
MNKKNKVASSAILLFSILFLIVFGSKSVFAYFNAYASESTIKMCKCEIKSYSILLENSDSYAELVSITYSGTGQNLVRVVPSNVFLNAGEKKQISVFLDSQCKEGEYYIDFYMESQSVKKVLKQKIVIQPCDILELKIEKSNLTIEKGKMQEVAFSITNKGTYIEELNFKFDRIKSENFFIEPNQTLKLSFNVSGQKLGNYKKELIVNALRTGYKKTSSIYINVVSAEKEENALKALIFSIGNFLKQFQKYIITALIILFVLLVILSIGLKKSEQRIIEEPKEEQKTKKIRKKKEEKEEKLSPYYISVIKERKGFTEFFKKNFKPIIIIIIIILAAVLIFFAIKYSWHSKIFGFFKKSSSLFLAKFSLNKTEQKEEIPKEFDENRQGMFVIEEANESAQQNEQNVSKNKTGTERGTLEQESREEIIEETLNQTTNQVKNQTNQTTEEEEEKIEENATEISLPTEATTEEIKKEKEKSAAKIRAELKSALTAIKVFFILYLNYIIYGIVALFIIIMILNVSVIKEKRKKNNNKRKKRQR